MPNTLQYCIDSAVKSEYESNPGQVLYLKGWAVDRRGPIESLATKIDNAIAPVFFYGMPRPDVADSYRGNGIDVSWYGASGFVAFLSLPQKPGIYEVHLVARLLDGSSAEVHAFTVSIVEKVARPAMATVSSGLVAICMATYKPKLSDLERQIQSIRNQIYKNWVCLIKDDASGPESLAIIRSVVGDDPRFRITQNPKNMGFYYNFEACLKEVPPEAEFIALSDQDDIWRADKIVTLVDLLKRRTADLAYSDVRIVDSAGTVLHNSYWTWRRNNFKDHRALWAANTVTGAASVFTRDVLDKALPFPDKIGDSFHDWWLALVAISGRGLAYCDEPLHDYVQHGRNVIGHCGGMGRPEKIGLRNRIRRSVDVFSHDLVRLQLAANTLYARMPDSSVAHDLKHMLPANLTSPTSLMTLLPWAIRGRLHRKLTVGAEERLLKSLISVNIYRHYFSPTLIGKALRLALKSARRLRRMAAPVPVLHGEQKPPRDRTGEDRRIALRGRVAEFQRKIAPLNLVVTPGQPASINLVIPVIDFSVLFGGYLGKFALAARLMESGQRVRIITIDHCVHDKERWKVLAKDYPGLEQVFAEAEIVDCHERSKPIKVSPSDRFIGTTWWTAHVIGNSLKGTDFPPFLYLIQEYEPLTFNHGSWHSAASASYDFDHVALFSTKLLMEYFSLNKIGVFAPGRGGIARYFNNAIVSLAPDPEGMKARKVRKLLMYLRPEEHASRNLCELGLAALDKAASDGLFPEDSWELWGVGSVSLGDSFTLPSGRTMYLLPKLSLLEYGRNLKNFDLGYSLMYTPHPSLVPIEMCSVGMPCVTTTFANKNAHSLGEISSNFIAAEPTIEGIVEALKVAIIRTGDFEARLKGARVSWPASWRQAFHDELLAEVMEMMGVVKAPKVPVNRYGALSDRHQAIARG